MRVGGTWIALDRGLEQVEILTGEKSEQVIPITASQGEDPAPGKGPPRREPTADFSEVLPVDDTHALVVRQVLTRGLAVPGHDPPPPGELRLSTIDLVAGSASPWEPVSGWFTGEPPAPRLTSVVSAQREADGALVLLGRKRDGSVGLLRRDADGAWVELKTMAPPEKSHIFYPRCLEGSGRLVRGAQPPRRLAEGRRLDDTLAPCHRRKEG